MPEITRKRTGEFLRILFSILIKTPDGLQASAALAAVEKQVKLTDYEQGTYAGGGRRFEKIVRFATIDCVKAGWLVKNKGQWSVTEDGKAAYEKYKDSEDFYREAVKLYAKWKSAQASQEVELNVDGEVTDKDVAITYEKAEEQAWGEIEQYLKAMNPYEFQELVADLLKAMGYHIAWIAPPGKDGGLDILALTDPLGTRNPKIKVQVKRQESRVSVDGLRSFMAVLGDDDVGLFVCTGGFTKDAQDEARTQDKRKITLIDLDRLFDLWVEHYEKLSNEARRRLPLKQIYFLSPEP
jgi:restriction system protein